MTAEVLDRRGIKDVKIENKLVGFEPFSQVASQLTPSRISSDLQVGRHPEHLREGGDIMYLQGGTRLEVSTSIGQNKGISSGEFLLPTTHLLTKGPDQYPLDDALVKLSRTDSLVDKIEVSYPEGSPNAHVAIVQTEAGTVVRKKFKRPSAGESNSTALDEIAKFSWAAESRGDKTSLVDVDGRDGVVYQAEDHIALGGFAVTTISTTGEFVILETAFVNPKKDVASIIDPELFHEALTLREQSLSERREHPIDPAEIAAEVDARLSLKGEYKSGEHFKAKDD